jgi:hypothetical protein
VAPSGHGSPMRRRFAHLSWARASRAHGRRSSPSGRHPPNSVNVGMSLPADHWRHRRAGAAVSGFESHRSPAERRRRARRPDPRPGRGRKPPSSSAVGSDPALWARVVQRPSPRPPTCRPSTAMYRNAAAQQGRRVAAAGSPVVDVRDQLEVWGNHARQSFTIGRAAMGRDA